MSDGNRRMRENVLELLQGGGAHGSFDDVIGQLPADLRGGRPEGQSHTPWRLVEHMRIAQHDILQFVIDPDYQSPPWPDGYWPEGDGPPSDAAWEQSLEEFRRDAAALRQVVEDPHTDVLAPIPHGEGQTVLREAMLAADHNAYHLGQLATLIALLQSQR